MDTARVLELRGTFQVRPRQVVHAPTALFDGLEVIRCFGFDVREPEPVRRRKIPGGTVKIVFALDGVFGGRRVEPTALVVGLHDHAGIAEHAGRMHSVQIQLNPLAARRLLGVPLHELRNTTVRLDDLVGRPALELTEHLAESGGWPDRFAAVAAFLRGQFADAEAHDPAVAHAVRLLQRSAGRASVSALAEEIGWSHRHFRRRFADQVGLPPKDYGALVKFSGALTALAGTPAPDLSAVAAHFGYYDQSHLTRACHRFAGLSPGRLIRTPTEDLPERERPRLPVSAQVVADSSNTGGGVRF
ncbi:AraC family transcriptional regulator [Nocardia sp. NPDC051832]|uniref:helix-turn-helix domain-containing protein n=1 Tax=Nocardia sp. NPDC051832 TaxID=3155673 RepID=UPI00343E7C2C